MTEHTLFVTVFYLVLLTFGITKKEKHFSLFFIGLCAFWFYTCVRQVRIDWKVLVNDVRELNELFSESGRIILDSGGFKERKSRHRRRTELTDLCSTVSMIYWTLSQPCTKQVSRENTDDRKKVLKCTMMWSIRTTNNVFRWQSAINKDVQSVRIVWESKKWKWSLKRR